MTGGGSSSILLDAFEEKILSVIGDAAATGVKSGVDTEEVTVTLELLPVVSPSTLDLAEEREVGELISHEIYNYVSLYTCVMKVAFILDGNPPLCQTPKPKRLCTEEMIDIQTRLLKEVTAL